MRENRISGSVLLEPGVGVEPTSAIHSMDAYYGLLRDVSAARRLSRSAFGGRANPGLVAPGDLDRVCRSRISLLKIVGCLSLLREYLVPYFFCYLSCGF